MKALWINSVSQTIEEIEYTGSDHMRELVGGGIEAGYIWANGDALYVDVDGLMKNPRYFFRITVRPDQPLAGNGLLVGKEIDNTSETAPPTMSIHRLRSEVQFLKTH
jgi:hypothetical protein